MNFDDILEWGLKRGIINSAQKESLRNISQEECKGASLEFVSPVVKLLYYIGGFMMLCAMAILSLNTITHGTYCNILGLGTIYSLLFLQIGKFLWEKKRKNPCRDYVFFIYCSLFADCYIY